METFLEYVEAQCPPGMDQWVASNKQAFMDTHGEQYQAFLMSAAWSLYRKIYRNSEVFSQ
jgi:hypothetical protein